MSEERIKDMIEPIPNCEFTYRYDGSRTCGKSYTQNLLEEKIKEIRDLKISNDEWKRKCSKYITILNNIKKYVNEYEVCLIKNGIPEIKRTDLLKIIEGE